MDIPRPRDSAPFRDPFKTGKYIAVPNDPLGNAYSNRRIAHRSHLFGRFAVDERKGGEEGEEATAW